MVEYRSIISSFPDGKVEIVTKTVDFVRKNNKLLTYPDGPYSEIHTKRYLSVENLREALVRERFHTDLSRYGGEIVYLFGLLFLSLSFTAIVANNPFLIGDDQRIQFIKDARLTQYLYGGPCAFFGHSLRQRGKGNKPIVDSKVHAFNQTFPDARPVSFNPREYLSTCRLPFFRR